jgi:hypothetical protein
VTAWRLLHLDLPVPDDLEPVEVPAAVIRISFEAERPSITFEGALGDGGDRLCQWLEAHPDLLELIRFALELRAEGAE